MGNIIHFIKKELFLAIVALGIFLVSFNLYRSQQNMNKEEQVEMLKSKINSEKRKLKKLIKEYEKEKKFEEKIKNLKIIKAPITLDIYKVADELRYVYFTYFGAKNIKIFYKPEKIRTSGIKKHIFYKVVLLMPYINKYLITDFLNYLKNNYFYTIQKVRYDTKTQDFRVILYLLGEKGKNTRMRRRRR